MNAQMVITAQGGLPPPGGQAFAKGDALAESPELQALFQSLMASLMGPMLIAQPLTPRPMVQAGEVLSAAANGTEPTAPNDTSVWVAQNSLLIGKETAPLAPSLGEASTAAATQAFAPLLSHQKSAIAQAQPAPILLENADPALLRTPPPTGQPTVDAAVTAAVTAQMASTQGDKSADEQLHPRLEVPNTPPSPTPSGIGPLVTINTVQTTVTPSRSAETTPLQQIADRVQVTLDQGENSATIRLQPEELGGVRIRLQVQDGQVYLSIQTEKPQTGRMIDQQLGDLRQSLESGGIKVGDLAVLAGNRAALAGAEALGREASPALKTLSMEMGGNSAQQQNQHQQQAAFAGQERHPERGNLPHYGQQMAEHGRVGNAATERTGAPDVWGWQSAPRGVDYYV